MNRFFFAQSLLGLLLASSAMAQEKPAASPLNEPLGEAGVVPVGADGKPLNLNFESGTLDGWKAEGKAFEGQPIKVGSSRVDLQACKLEYSIVSPK